MTNFETEKIASLASNNTEIAKQLKIANKLKAIELKMKYPEATSFIDDLADEIDS